VCLKHWKTPILKFSAIFGSLSRKIRGRNICHFSSQHDKPETPKNALRKTYYHRLVNGMTLLEVYLSSVTPAIFDPAPSYVLLRASCSRDDILECGLHIKKCSVTEFAPLLESYPLKYLPGFWQPPVIKRPYQHHNIDCRGDRALHSHNCRLVLVLVIRSVSVLEITEVTKSWFFRLFFSCPWN